MQFVQPFIASTACYAFDMVKCPRIVYMDLDTSWLLAEVQRGWLGDLTPVPTHERVRKPALFLSGSFAISLVEVPARSTSKAHHNILVHRHFW
jgi:hypothetical protein